MDWFERYLQAVGKHLPWERQDDILAELRGNLESQLEDRQETLGRPLTEGEMLDWLKELGPPLSMAARYQPTRYLIGPNIFPMYWHILRLVMLWATVAFFVGTLIRTIAERHAEGWFAKAIGDYPGVLFAAAAWVTIIFAVFEYVSERYPEKCPPFLCTSPRWSPTTLAPMEKSSALEGKPRPLTVAIAEFVVNFFVLSWLVLIPRYPVLALGPASAFLRQSPLLVTSAVVWFYWTAVALHAMQWGWQGYNLLAEKWRTKHLRQRLTTKALGVIPIAILLGAPGHLYVFRNPQSAAATPDISQITAINHFIFLGCAVVAAIVVIDLAAEASKTRNLARSHQFRIVL